MKLKPATLKQPALPAFSHWSLVARHSSLPDAFTLLELLVVIGIISLLLVAVIPAVNSLSKSSGRKGAISNLTSVIEQTRSLALSDARNTYIAFATVFPGAAPPTMVRDYSYRAYAVFQDDASGTAHSVQITKWQKLPSGISFRNRDEPTSTGTCITSTANATTTTFLFTPLGSPITCPYIQFDPTGAIVQPTSTAPMRLVIFEGDVTGTNEVPTARESSGDPVRDEVQVERYTGRAKYVIR